MSARLWVFALVGIPLVPAAARADDDRAAELAAKIDRQLEADWAAAGVTPAAPADDAEFCRRVYLDLVGRTPRVAEVRDFLADPAADKRARLVDRLLTLPSHAAHFAAVTRAAWLPQTVTNPQFLGFGVQFEGWLRDRFKENTPADEVARRVLTVGVRQGRRNDPRFLQPDGADPDAARLVAFYQANDGKPENVGAAVSRLFVGVKLECAQCHDHPFAPYTKEQFWEFAAFFAELDPLAGRRPGDASDLGPQRERNRLTIPNTSKVAVARFFDGRDPEWSDQKTPRQELAGWLTRPDNEYFGRNLANRMWAHFFGAGIVDPVDEPGENNPPSHPELLDTLGREFVAAKFDNRLLIRAITRTRAYQLTSRLSHPTQADPKHFARMGLKGLTPAQLFDSLVAATGHREAPFLRANTFPGFTDPGNPRSKFLSRFQGGEKPTEANTTILQALMLMNGDFLGGQTATDRAELLGAVADIPGWDTARRVEALFLAAFARRPTPDEAQRFGSYVDRGGPTGDKKKALGDVFWVLLNSPEFLFNH
jgi:hypothetical protein